MKTLQRLFCLATLLFCGNLHAADPLKFVVWNIEWFPGHRPTASEKEADDHMKTAQAALKKINPDIFVAEEIRDWEAFRELVSVVPGLTVHVVSSFRDPESGVIRAQQIGIASKLPCRGAWWENWKANYPNISRGFSYAALEHPDGGLLMIYGNHLKSNNGSDTEEGAKNVAAMRAEQAKQLLAHREEMKLAYSDHKIAGWIAAGDFNTNHDGQFPFCEVVKTMTAGGYFNTWAATPKAKRLTWHPEPGGRFEATTFDYIFTAGIKETNAVIVDVPKDVSDHSPVGLPIMLP